MGLKIGGIRSTISCRYLEGEEGDINWIRLLRMLDMPEENSSLSRRYNIGSCSSESDIRDPLRSSTMPLKTWFLSSSKLC